MTTARVRASPYITYEVDCCVSHSVVCTLVFEKQRHC
jgi:hypothetical protein